MKKSTKALLIALVIIEFAAIVLLTTKVILLNEELRKEVELRKFTDKVNESLIFGN